MSKTKSTGVAPHGPAILFALTAVVFGIAIASGGGVMWRPFTNPLATKIMAGLTTVIVWFGTIASVFLADRRGAVALACCGALICTYAIGLTITAV